MFDKTINILINLYFISIHQSDSRKAIISHFIHNIYLFILLITKMTKNI